MHAYAYGEHEARVGRWAADDTAAMFRYRAHVDGAAWNQWDPERIGPHNVFEAMDEALAALRDRHRVSPADPSADDPPADPPADPSSDPRADPLRPPAAPADPR
jgi:hypothetical protein